MLRVGVVAFAFLYAALFAYMIAGATGSFAIDESLYLAMADAMATRGDLAIQSDGGVAGAPSLTVALSGYGADGRVYPQYPAGYAFIAAPFYLIGGVAGLFMLNAIAGLIAIGLVRDIAMRLYRDEKIALLAAALFVACTYFLTYAFAIWPHVLTLAMLLGAASAALRGADRTRARLPLLALSGALIAAAATVRVDSVIFFAPVFIWLRLVAAPGNRAAALVFLAGGVPLLALASIFNYVKYGVAAPITYGDPSGYETLGDYAPMATAAIIGGASLFIIDAEKAAPVIKKAALQRGFLIAFGAGVLGALILLHRQIFTLAHHLWTLLVDIQAYNGDYFHDELKPDAKGFLTTFGMPKKALLQSMPYFVATLVCAYDLMRGRRVRAASFCFLFAAAPIVFFALKQWHGGYALNMRFFFPAVPFLAILSAAAIAPLLARENDAPKRFLYAVACGCLGLIVLQMLLVKTYPGYGVIITTHSPLLAAFALSIATGAHLFRRSAAASRAFLIAAGVAVGAAGASNFGDFTLTKEKRSRSGRADAYFARVAPKGALIVSLEETQLAGALARGVSLLHPYDGEEKKVAEAIAAFDAAGRCVYVKKGEIADFARAATGLTFVSAANNPPAALDWFDTLAPIRPGCALP